MWRCLIFFYIIQQVSIKRCRICHTYTSRQQTRKLYYLICENIILWWGSSWVYLCFSVLCCIEEDYILYSQQQESARQQKPYMKINMFPQSKPSASQTQVKGSSVMFSPNTFCWATTTTPLGILTYWKIDVPNKIYMLLKWYYKCILQVCQRCSQHKSVIKKSQIKNKGNGCTWVQCCGAICYFSILLKQKEVNAGGVSAWTESFEFMKMFVLRWNSNDEHLFYCRQRWTLGMNWLESATNFMIAKGANDCHSPFPHILKARFLPWPHYFSSSLPISSPVGNWQAENYEALAHQICMSIYFQTQHRLRDPSLLSLYSASVCPVFSYMMYILI